MKLLTNGKKVFRVKENPIFKTLQHIVYKLKGKESRGYIVEVNSSTKQLLVQKHVKPDQMVIPEPDWINFSEVIRIEKNPPVANNPPILAKIEPVSAVEIFWPIGSKTIPTPTKEQAYKMFLEEKKSIEGAAFDYGKKHFTRYKGNAYLIGYVHKYGVNTLHCIIIWK